MRRLLALLLLLTPACASCGEQPPALTLQAQEGKFEGFLDEFVSLSDFLWTNLPLEVGLQVEVTLPSRGAWGDTGWNPDIQRYIIRVHPAACPTVAFWTLLHEYSHCLVWDVPCTGEHGPYWGVAYSQCWEVYEDWLAI